MSVDQLIENIFDFVFRHSEAGFTKLGIALAAILLGISILKTADDYINANNSGIISIIKPLIIFLWVCTYPTVSGTVKATVNIFTREIVATSDVDIKDYWSAFAECTDKSMENSWQKLIDSVKEDKKKAQEAAGIWNTAKGWLDVTASAISGFYELKASISGISWTSVLGWLLFFLSKIMIFILMIVSGLYLLILEVFGVFMFAIAILPAFESGIRNWISRYIQLALWTPMCYIILALSVGLLQNLGNVNPHDFSLALPWITICCQLVILGALMNVPNMCGWFIESAGANRVHSNLMSGASKAFRMMATKGK